MMRTLPPLPTVLSKDELMRVAGEVIAHSPGIGEEQVIKALREAEVVAFTATLIEMWRDGTVSLGWSEDEQDLVFHSGKPVRP